MTRMKLITLLKFWMKSNFKNDPTLQKSLRIKAYADKERSNRSDLLGHTPQSHRPHPYACEGRGMLVTKN